MGDSDDDYDRKRRDKFRGERSVGSDRREWVDRGRPKADYRDYRPPRDRSNYSPGRDYPPMKRMRGDWDDGRSRYGGGGHDPYAGYGWGGAHEHYGMHAPAVGGGGYGALPREHHHREPTTSSDVQTQPRMMTLKQFLATQDDSISDSDAMTKYNEYKLDFKRQQLNEFFVTHKDEEWFKLKYHPEDSVKRKAEQLDFLKKRVEVFVEMLQEIAETGVTVDTNQSGKLLRLLDTVVIKLEGGTEEDIKALDEKPVDVVAVSDDPKAEDGKDTTKDDKITVIEDDDDENSKAEKAKPEDIDSSKENGGGSKKRKHSKSGSDSSSSSSDSDSDDEEKKEPEKMEEEKNENGEEKPVDSAAEESMEKPVVADNEEGEANADADEESEKEKKEEKADDSDDDEDSEKDKSTNGKAEESVTEEKQELGPRSLHKTSSIFLRNLAPTITKAEVEAVCRKYDGYLRVAIADPLIERRWFRRGWVSFRRDVNIKEICWNLNNIRLRDCELGAIVNRDLSRRVRPVNGITNHKTIIRNDIKVCAKIVHNLDEKYPLWKDEDSEETTKKATFGFQSKNPVLQNITDYLIEEASAEEDELLGLTGDEAKESEANGDENFERDPVLISVLDKLILYLRVVHSVDFYNHCEYPYEDEMPNRCGIIHVRMAVPQSKVTNQEVQDYIKNFETKMETFLQKNIVIAEEELKKLGIKDPEQEVEKFIAANTQELAKDKWLCPLSGKKFKGPEFIRKHILNKHGEKVDEVRKEVEYFNNYLKDGKRPQLPENPANVKKEGQGKDQSPTMGYRQPYPGPAYGAPYGHPYGPSIGGPRGRGPGGFNQRRPMPADFRPIIHYRDLDAPRESDDMFL